VSYISSSARLCPEGYDFFFYAYPQCDVLQLPPQLPGCCCTTRRACCCLSGGIMLLGAASLWWLTGCR